MRVIAGAARGCVLSAPKGRNTRPTADRLKENLFNLLSPRLPDARFLDLFSGSGAIGIEALSRGAREAVLVEYVPEALSVIRMNLQKTRLAERAQILPIPAERAVKALSREGRQFDIIFLDPPYDRGLVTDTLNQLQHTKLLPPAGVMVAEISSRANLPSVTWFEITKTKIYGNTAFVFYGWRQPV